MKKEIASMRNSSGKLGTGNPPRKIPPEKKNPSSIVRVSRARKSFVLCSRPTELRSRDTDAGSVYCYSPPRRIDERGIDRQIELRRGNVGKGDKEIGRSILKGMACGKD